MLKWFYNFAKFRREREKGRNAKHFIFQSMISGFYSNRNWIEGLVICYEKRFRYQAFFSYHSRVFFIVLSLRYWFEDFTERRNFTTLFWISQIARESSAFHRKSGSDPIANNYSGCYDLQREREFARRKFEYPSWGWNARYRDVPVWLPHKDRNLYEPLLSLVLLL